MKPKPSPLTLLMVAGYVAAALVAVALVALALTPY